MNETKVMLIVSGVGVVAIATACFFIFRTPAPPPQPQALVAAKPGAQGAPPAAQRPTPAAAPKPIAVAPAPKPVAAPVRAPAVVTPAPVAAPPPPPPQKREETPREMLARFNVFTKATLLPALEVYKKKTLAQIAAMSPRDPDSDTVSTSKYELVSTDLKRTDSAVNPLVAVAVLRRYNDTKSEKHNFIFYSTQELTLTFAPDEKGGWTPVRSTTRTVKDAGFSPSTGQYDKPPAGETEDAIRWLEDALAGKDPPEIPKS